MRGSKPPLGWCSSGGWRHGAGLPVTWSPRRLAAVGLVATGAATKVGVAAGFEVDTDSQRRWSRAWEAGGAAALAPGQRGPEGPSKVTAEVVAAVAKLRSGGSMIAAAAAELGLSVDSVRSAIALGSTVAPPRPGASALEPLARPEPRDEERALASAGLLAGAPPVICEGASLPAAGTLLVLPALALTGLVEVVEKVLGLPKAALCSLRPLLLALVFLALLGEPRAEGASRVYPVAVGRLLGLDRGPEVKTLRRSMEALAGLRRSEELLMALARHHAAAHPEAMGLLYVDGHVRSYHGEADLPRAHLAKARTAMAAPPALVGRPGRRRRAGVVVSSGGLPRRRAEGCGPLGAGPARPRRPAHHLLRPGRLEPEAVRRAGRDGL